MEFFNESVFFGVFFSLLSYEIGIWCKKKWKIAMEMGEIEGAMSGLSIAVSGILTVFMAVLFSNFY